MARVVVDHLVLRVKDIERSRRFCDLVLGCSRLQGQAQFCGCRRLQQWQDAAWIGEADAEEKR